MKVLYVVTAYPRWTGDVITPWLVETIHRLKARGVEVEVLAPAYRGLGSQVVDGVRVHRFRYAPAAWETLTHDQTAPDRVRERPRYLGLVPGYVVAGCVAATRLARDFDVVHVFWPLPHGLFGLSAKKFADVPVVATFFGVELRWVESQLPFLRPVLRRVVRGADAVTVISSHTAAALRAVHPAAQVEVIPFGAAVPPASPDRTSPARPPGAFRLLFVGRLVERKGVQVLLRALEAVEAEVALTVVGDGPWRGRLEALASELGVEDRVRFAGTVPAADLAGEMRACDALVLPAVRDAKGDEEGLGVVLIEAMGYCKPVIASASGGIVDIVRDGETGLLVPPGDAAALARAVDALAADPALRQALATRGAEHAAREFSWESIVARLVALYGRVAR